MYNIAEYNKYPHADGVRKLHVHTVYTHVTHWTQPVNTAVWGYEICMQRQMH